MKPSLLARLIDQGEELPATGDILVLNPGAEDDLSDLPQARILAVQGFYPDHQALAARGLRVTPQPEGQDYAAALVFLPRARAAGRALLAQALDRLRPGAPLYVEGARHDGIDSMLKDLRARQDQGLILGESLSKAHGRIIPLRAVPPGLFADWRAAPAVVAPGFQTLPGVFSADGIDRGSALLAAALPDTLGARVADLGAGWGWLAAQALARQGPREIHLVEADHQALACARANITDPRAQFHWGDARSWRPARPVETVVMNPPFHQGRDSDPGLGLAFIRQAAAILVPPGVLWMVANRHLPYEPLLKTLFRDVETLGLAEGFRLFRAQHVLKSPAVSPQAPAGRRPAGPRMGAGPRGRR